METSPCKFPSVPYHPLGLPSAIVRIPSSGAVTVFILPFRNSLVTTVVHAQAGFFSDNICTRLQRGDPPSLLHSDNSGEIPYPSMVTGRHVCTELSHGGPLSLLSRDVPAVAPALLRPGFLIAYFVPLQLLFCLPSYYQKKNKPLFCVSSVAGAQDNC